MKRAEVLPGKPYPLGATYLGNGVNFAVFSEHARKVEVCVFDPDNPAREVRRYVLPELERQFGLGMATPRDMARLMALIGQGKAVSPESSAAMLATLRQQQDRAMIPRLLPDDDVHVANKTGTDEEKRPGPGGRRGHVRADVAVVASPRASYAVAIYARHVEDGRWGVENDALTTGARISRLLFEHYSRARKRP